MFDFAWSEIALIGVVALIAIGPKDMPAAIRTITSAIKKARRMAAEFQTHVDEMVREAELGDVKNAFNEIRNFDVRGTVERAIDPDRSLRRTFEEDPFKPTYPTAAEVSTLDEVAVSAPPATLTGNAADPDTQHSATPEAGMPVSPPGQEHVAGPAPPSGAPDWVPPGMVPPPKVTAATPPGEAPAWVPPEIVARRRDTA
jgi:sec-independent protein translocase protein TatB